MDWDNKIASKDPYNRFRFGIPPGQDKADFAFIQHMFSSLNDKGQVAVICFQGVLFRGNEESRIRENMITEDIIEGIIALPPKLFFGTGIPCCILILNKKKLEKRKNKIIFIYAAKDFEEGKVRNLLREEDIDTNSHKEIPYELKVSILIMMDYVFWYGRMKRCVWTINSFNPYYDGLCFLI